MEHRKKRGQISVEYIAIVGFVMIVLSGTMVFFQGYAMSSKEQITKTKVDIIANTIIDNAREIYYLGEGSKKVITVDMPDGIKEMGVVKEGASGLNPDNYFLLFDVYGTKGSSGMLFESEVPIQNDGTSGLCVLYDTICSAFSASLYSPGKKMIRIEAITDSSSNTIIKIEMQPE